MGGHVGNQEVTKSNIYYPRQDGNCHMFFPSWIMKYLDKLKWKPPQNQYPPENIENLSKPLITCLSYFVFNLSLYNLITE